MPVLLPHKVAMGMGHEGEGENVGEGVGEGDKIGEGLGEGDRVAEGEGGREEVGEGEGEGEEGGTEEEGAGGRDEGMSPLLGLI